MPNLNRETLSAAVASRLAVPQAQAEAAVEAVLVCLAEGFAAGQGVCLNGFGQFRVRDCKAFTCRNPRTGEAIAIPARRKVSFRFTGDL